MREISVDKLLKMMAELYVQYKMQEENSFLLLEENKKLKALLEEKQKEE